MKSKNSKNGKNSNPTVGRPESKVVWPNGYFTREQAYKLNGCFEKPARICKLTVINHLNEDMFIMKDVKTDKKDKNGNVIMKRVKVRLNPNSTIVKVSDRHGEPVGGKLGRKPEMYIRRSQLNNGKKGAAKTAELRKAKAAVATVAIPVAQDIPAAVPAATPEVVEDAAPTAPVAEPTAATVS